MPAPASPNKEPEWLAEHRKASLERFKTLPSLIKYGLGIFADTNLLQTPQLNHASQSTDDQQITSDSRVEVCTLAEGIEKYPSHIAKCFSTVPQDKLLALHHAIFSTGTVIRVPANTSCKPVQINLTLKSEARIEFLFIIAEKNSSVTIFDNAQGGQASYRSQAVHITAQEGATVKYISTQQFEEQTTSISRKQASVAKNASVTWIDCCLGSKFAQSTTKTILEEQEAEGKTYGLFFGTNKQVFDLNAQTIHRASKTSSNMLTKGALNGNAKTIYRGLVRIEQDAHECIGHQKEDTLMLSEHAEADAVPYLEINNNNVKCGHGATVCQPDKEKIFYLMSRGLSEQEAKKNMVEGFFEPVILEINDDAISNQIRETISRYAEC
ncbi:MAG: Fe-S cluster assembly protein SufD [Candidatus Aenigmarchaeota archaeon]|nr:Fe-S cluster assembly protein SufD [Candidatus Aenigmarchaeota archaeon]